MSRRRDEPPAPQIPHVKPMAKQPGVAAAGELTPQRRSAWRRPMFMAGGCLGGLILLLVVLVGGVLLLTGGAVDAAKEHLGLIKEGRVEEAYQATSPDFQKLVTLAGYRELVEARATVLATAEIGVPERDVENGVATITAQIKDVGGAVYDVPMRLRKEGDAWRMIAIDFSEVPVGSPSGAPVDPAVPRADPVKAPEDPLPAAPPSVGTVVFGSGRDDAGDLIWPGNQVSRTAGQISADIQLINHPAGGRVRVWIERKGGGARTEPVEGSVEGQGSGNLTFNLKLGKEGIEPGDYLLVVQLGEGERSETAFKVK